MCWKQNNFYFKNERKEGIFVVLCQICNINQEKIQKYVLIMLLLDSSWYILCKVLSQQFVNSSQAHWIQYIWKGLIPLNFFYFLQGNNHKRVVLWGTKAYWDNPYQLISAVWRPIISRESDQGAISPIEVITSHLLLAARQ